MTQDRRVAVIGLGYVGLPLAISFVEAGLEVEGIDAYAGRVEELNAGSSPIDDVTNDRLAAALRSGLRVLSPGGGGPRRRRRDLRLRPHADHHRRRTRTSRPVLAAAETIRGALRKGQLIVLQSTTYPGHDDWARSARSSSGAASRPATDFDLAFAPERVNPGDPASASKGVPRLVGATTPEATQARRGAAREHQRPRHRDELARRRRAQQAPRERVPQRQHRVREPARAAVRADGARRLGGHQRRGDEAVRVHEVHARARASAATASRSIRTTWPGGRASSTSSIASSSSPATSTSRCRATWSGWSPTR